ncbi:MAG: hypothetical protein JNJ88_14635 [Planctomycetes bacterium]|nr:hypothetical protein [Planctomycetota bacterium]
MQLGAGVAGAGLTAALVYVAFFTRLDFLPFSPSPKNHQFQELERSLDALAQRLEEAGGEEEFNDAAEDGAPPGRVAARSKAALVEPTAAPAGAPPTPAPSASAPSLREPASRGRILGFVPGDAWLVVRCPKLRELRTALLDPRITKAITSLLPGELTKSAQSEMLGFLAEAEPRHQRAFELASAMADGQGEFALAVRGFPNVAGSNALKSGGLQIALLADMGSRTGVLEGLIARLDKTAPADGTTLQIHAAARDGVAILIGSDSAIAQPLEPWKAAHATSSFLTKPICHEAPKALANGDEPGLEILADFATLAQTLPIPKGAAESVLQATGLRSVHGVSLLVGGRNGRFSEEFGVHTEGETVLQRVLSPQPIDPAWARWAFSDADSGSIASLPLGRLYSEVAALLPSKEQNELQTTLHSLRERYALDLRADLMEQLGPQIVVSTRVRTGKRPAQSLPYDVAIAVEVHKPERLKVALDGILKIAGISGSKRTQRIQGVGDVYTLVPESGAAARMPGFEPCFAFSDHALLFTTSIDGMKRLMGAPRDTASGFPARLERAASSAADGAIFASVSDTAAQIRQLLGSMPQPQKSAAAGSELLQGLGTGSAASDTVVIGICHESGFSFRAESPDFPALTGGTLIGAAISASVALPSLLSVRIESNEQAAIARLRAIAKSQLRFRENRVIDADGDGVGEFGFFGELTGAHMLRGQSMALEPPLLEPDAKPMTAGTSMRSGYLFRIDLPAENGSMTAGPPSKEEVSISGAEKRFVAYAWPVDFGTSGRRVFFVDENGEVYASDNISSAQHYSGAGKSPGYDAALPRTTAKSTADLGSYRNARDGALWERLPR